MYVFLCACEVVNIGRKSCVFFLGINFLVISHQLNISLQINVVKYPIRQACKGKKCKVYAETVT